VETQTLAHRSTPSKRLVLRILLGLDAFCAGGLTALLAVNHLLQQHLDIYAPDNMVAASAVLDLMDNLLAYLFPCAVALLVLVLFSILVGVWIKVRP